MGRDRAGARTDPYVDGVLAGVEKPSRYIDCELNLRGGGFEPGRFNVLLVFPDVYEIGMSHQGLRVLYHALSDMKRVGVEFAFAPWPDLEERLRRCGEPLRSWQTGTPAGRFDLIGITLPYELHYTNALNIIDLAGVPVDAADRDDGDPLVVAGGPCVSNPFPVVGAFDAFFIGDGEESIVEAAAALAALGAGAPRRRRLEALAAIEGVWIDGISGPVRARTSPLERSPLASSPIVPAADIVHDRLSIEIMRGCTRGCRFCHAGMTYRPRRERGVDEIVRAAAGGIDATGWEEVSLLSLSSSDYTHLEELLERLAPELERRCVSLALPSLRPETVTERIVEATSRVRRSGFTIAPEAGTERLRTVINKCMSDEEIMRGVGRILDAGWQNLKLYFMIGLPTETDEDLDGIVSLIGRIMRMPAARRRFRLSVTISPFVPKPHTPFQWERQASIAEIEEKERYLLQRIRRGKVDMGLREPRVSALEGILARGGRGVWPVVREAWRAGARFDSWRDRLRFDLWENALAGAGLTVDGLLAGFDPGAELPWDAIEAKVSKRFLLLERERAFTGEPTADCREGACTGCGACRDEAEIEASTSGGAASPRSGVRSDAAAPQCPGAGETVEPVRYRFQYRKAGRARYLSHRELTNVIHRALRRSGLPLHFSEGFHPHPRISLGPALAVGTSGEAEFFDAEFTEDGKITFRALAGLFPRGIEATASAGPFSRREGKVPAEAVCDYEIDLLPPGLALSGGGNAGAATGSPSADISSGRTEILSGGEAVWYCLAQGSALDGQPAVPAFGDPAEAAAWVRGRWEEMIEAGEPLTDRKGRSRRIDACSLLDATDPCVVALRIDGAAGGAPTPADLLTAVMPRSVAELAKVTRTGIYYRRGGRMLAPLDLITGPV
jgi:radical SAM superfamily enzyme YgiQ (UPF0313 family)